MPGSRIRRALRHILGTPASGDTELARWRASVDRNLDTLLTEQRALLKALTADARDQSRWRWQFRRQIDAVVRRQALADADLAAPLWLEGQRFHLRSQNEEDGITLALLRLAGTPTRRFVEVGCGGTGSNSAVLAFELGWGGLMIDASRRKTTQLAREVRFNPSVHVVCARVTPDNVNVLIRDHGLAGEIDFMAIDIDSVDYWVLDAVEACSPRVLVTEYNARFGSDRAVTIPVEGPPPNAPKGYHGASLAALARKAREKGYGLIGCETEGVNAFFLRDDVAREVPRVPVEVAYRPRRRWLDRDAAGGADEQLLAAIEAHGLPLVDV